MIRQATTADAPSIADLWNPWIRDTAVTFSPTEKSRADLTGMIASRPCFLVAINPDLLGFATYDQFRSGAGYATCMEHTIILAPQAHGQGTGRALMQALESHAAAHGAHQMIAGVSAENPAGIAFHSRLGYAEIARVAQAGYKFGRFIDLVLLQKFLT